MVIAPNQMADAAQPNPAAAAENQWRQGNASISPILLPSFPIPLSSNSARPRAAPQYRTTLAPIWITLGRRAQIRSRQNPTLRVPRSGPTGRSFSYGVAGNQFAGLV